MLKLHTTPIISSQHGDGTRRVIATVGDRAYLEDKISGQREEWHRYYGAEPTTAPRLIDGKPYYRVGTVVPVKREGGAL